MFFELRYSLQVIEVILKTVKIVGLPWWKRRSRIDILDNRDRPFCKSRRISSALCLDETSYRGTAVPQGWVHCQESVSLERHESRWALFHLMEASPEQLEAK